MNEKKRYSRSNTTYVQIVLNFPSSVLFRIFQKTFNKLSCHDERKLLGGTLTCHVAVIVNTRGSFPFITLIVPISFWCCPTHTHQLTVLRRISQNERFGVVTPFHRITLSHCKIHDSSEIVLLLSVPPRKSHNRRISTNGLKNKLCYLHVVHIFCEIVSIFQCHRRVVTSVENRKTHTDCGRHGKSSAKRSESIILDAKRKFKSSLVLNLSGIRPRLSFLIAS